MSTLKWWCFEQKLTSPLIFVLSTLYVIKRSLSVPCNHSPNAQPPIPIPKYQTLLNYFVQLSSITKIFQRENSIAITSRSWTMNCHQPPLLYNPTTFTTNQDMEPEEKHPTCNHLSLPFSLNPNKGKSLC